MAIISGPTPIRASARKSCVTSFPGGDRVAQEAVMPAFFDRNRDVSAAFESLHPDLVVDAAGPFQNYSDNLDRMVDTSLAFGADDVWPMLPPSCAASVVSTRRQRSAVALRLPAQALASH
jgi:hypothetical protein